MESKCKRRNGKRILWVEDDYYHLKGLVKPVEKAGFQVVPARSYVEAKLILSKCTSFCLVLLDLIIPYSDFEPVASDIPPVDRTTIDEDINSLTRNGLALFDYLVNTLKLSVPIVVLSVVQTKTIVDTLVDRGAAAYVRKVGLMPREVLSIVKGAIQDCESCD